MTESLKRPRTLVATTLVIVSLAWMGACGGGGTHFTPPAAASLPVSVSITPSNTQLVQGGLLQFSASVFNTANAAVTWSVQEGAAGGSISATGLYTAPKAAGTFHVVATSAADITKAASAEVFVPAVSVSMNTGNISMGKSENYAFVATVTGAADQTVSWAVQEGAAGGSITSAGAYTSPNATGSFHVVATSNWDNTKSATAQVTVDPLSVSVFPTSDILGPAGVRLFSASVVGSINTGVTWSVQEGVAGGSVSSGGFYVSPGTLGSYHVVAAAAKDPTTTATATLTIVASGFGPTGNMAAMRTAATATLLNNGKVLVAGGNSCFYLGYYYGFGNCALASAELFDPVAGTFSATGSMTALRHFHTANLLVDGKVLVTGGGGNAALITNTAELFDPAAGTFAATGSLSTARKYHTATVLASGNVLVVGGYAGFPTYLASSEEYDAAAKTFTTKGSMATPRFSHTATRLGNGKVLIAGGFSGSQNLASAELYDPATGNFTATGNMTQARSGHTASLLPNGNVLITGGSSGGPDLASAEIYDVVSGTFSATGSMLSARNGHVAVSLQNGKVLVAGGVCCDALDFTAEIYDPIAGTFTRTGSLSTGRLSAVAVLLGNGNVLVAGGSDLNSAEIHK